MFQAAHIIKEIYGETACFKHVYMLAIHCRLQWVVENICSKQAFSEEEKYASKECFKHIFGVYENVYSRNKAFISAYFNSKFT